MPRTLASTRTKSSSRTLALRRVRIRDFVKSGSFNGSSSLVTIPNTPSTTNFNFAFWVNLTIPTTSDRILDWQDAGPNNGFTINVGSTGFNFVISNGASETARIIATPSSYGIWNHIVGTFTTNSVKIYLNSVLQATDTSSVMGAATQTLTIGRRSTGASNFVNGLLDELLFYNGTPWTQAQIDELYFQGTIPTVDTYLNFNDQVNDQSGNGNNGTASNLSYSTEVPSKPRVIY